MRILITGSRDWDNAKSIYARIAEAINAWIEDHPSISKSDPLSWVTIVHGDCKQGADRIADIFSETVLKKEAEKYPADWKTFRKSAGFRRNRYMVNTMPDVCLAFIRNNSKGSTGCRDLAKAAGIPTETFRYEDELEIFPLES